MLANSKSKLVAKRARMVSLRKLLRKLFLSCSKRSLKKPASNPQRSMAETRKPEPAISTRLKWSVSIRETQTLL